ncbi:nucleolar complex protein 3 homolog [Fopius arisanus]|uniref:NOC3-like protein n=1 Tax=Fopius arisanus TaxID=64838 RepID=A0A9R1TUT3_9HYME|nr:PREDICTED: nucleolar complex protein 3 homolog [Fopius arisanus]
MDFESPDVEKEFPGLYASESARKSNESDFSDEGGHDKHLKKELLGGKKRDKKDKKDRGYATLEGESSADEDQETKSPSKSKKSKAFKFPSKKREKSREKEIKDKDKDENKDKEKKKREKDEKDKDKDKLKHKVKDRKKCKHGEEVADIGEAQPIFGVGLQAAVERSRCHDGVELPLVVRNCIDYLEEFGMTTESLYKIPGVKSKVQSFKKLYNQRETVNVQELEPAVAASLLILFLKELPEPVLESSGMISRFEQAASAKEVAQRESQLSQLVKQLPTCNRVLLAWVTLHLDHITVREKTTKMNAQTVAMTLSPVLQMSHRLLLALLCHCKSLFPDIILTKYIPPLPSGSANLPDEPESIALELVKQESLLAQIHMQMNAGFVTKSREEQLWEVQRIITQLKRKYKIAQKLEGQVQKSLDEDTRSNDEHHGNLQKSDQTHNSTETISSALKNPQNTEPKSNEQFKGNCDPTIPVGEVATQFTPIEERSHSSTNTIKMEKTDENSFIDPQISEATTEQVSLEKVRESLIYGELLNTETSLRTRIQQEKNEIKKLLNILAEKGPEKPISRDRTHSPNEAEMTVMIQLSKENQLLEKKMTTLIRSIIEEKDACVELKVQLAMHQLMESNTLQTKMQKPKSKKLKISKVKRTNQKRNKLSKQGKLKQRRHRTKTTQSMKQQNVEKIDPINNEESDQGEDLLEMVEKDDLKFLQSAISEKSYNLLRKIRLAEDPGERKGRKQKRKLKDENEELEDLYEDKVLNGSGNEERKKVRLMLPVKTKEGVIKKKIVEQDDEPETVNKLDDSQTEMDDNQEASDVDSDAGIGDIKIRSIDNDDVKDNVTTVELLACRNQVLKSRKLKIGILSSSLLENPQTKAHNFKVLLDFLDESNPEVCITVKKLTIVSLLEVFKDLLPAYSINTGTKEEGVRYKKETLELKNYEEILVRSYKNYLQKLERMAGALRRKRGDTRLIDNFQLELGQLAVSSLCQLLITHPYFNFSVNIGNFLIPLLDNRHEKIRQIIFQCFSQIFKDDKRGELSLSIVRKLNHYIKQHEQTVHPEIISVLLSLRIKDINLDAERKEEAKKKKLTSHKQRILALSKRERKKNKKLAEIEQEMLETKATENKMRKEKMLTEITSIVFTIYFRILKRTPNRRILSVCLEGLAKFAACINLEFYQDLVNAINALVNDGNLNQRDQLHCIQTVFTILSGQGCTLNIDPYVFYVHLYKQLFNIHAGKTQRDCRIVVDILHQVLIQRRKKVSQNRLIAFVKRIITISLQMQHHGTLGLLGLIKSIMQLNKNVDLLLDTDNTAGEGLYQPELDEPEYCNAHRSALWELVPLQRHYHSIVQKVSRYIACHVPATGDGTLPVEILKLSSSELYENYDPSDVAFNPVVPVPKKSSIPKQIKKWEFNSGEFEDYIKLIKSRSSSTHREFMDFSSEIL